MQSCLRSPAATLPSAMFHVWIGRPVSAAVPTSEHHRTRSSSRLPAQLARCQPRPHLPATSFDARRLARSAARRAIRSSAHLARPCRLVRRRPPSAAPCARGQRVRPCACDGIAWHPLELSRGADRSGHSACSVTAACFSLPSSGELVGAPRACPAGPPAGRSRSHGQLSLRVEGGDSLATAVAACGCEMARAVAALHSLTEVPGRAMAPA